LDAALEEFAAKGFSGARVGDIAERAGLNKQLINYYFDNKEGLYREVQRAWLEREAIFAGPEVALEELVTRYLHDALSDPRAMRLLIWRGLSEPGDGPPDITPDREDLSSLRRRQDAGELASDLDLAAVRLLLVGAVAAPVAMPQLVRKLFGIAPSAPEFEERYGEALRHIVRRLAERPPTERKRRRAARPGGAATDPGDAS